MLKKLLLVVVMLEVFTYIFMGRVTHKNNSYKHVLEVENKIDINKLKLENYIIGVVAAEMPATFSFDALKAQAVAARTFIYKKIVDNSVDYNNIENDKGQAYITVSEMKDKWKNNFDENYKKIKSAVKETQGEILIFDDKPINAYYFSSSNGYTENATAVFGEESYLVSVDSSWDVDNKEYNAKKNISLDEFKSKLNINEDVVIDDINRSSTSHVDTITINSKVIKGTDFRKLFNLRSTDFDISIDEKNVSITTRGYGHGVGMSQYGANYLAGMGKNYVEILTYYYKGVTLKKI